MTSARPEVREYRGRLADLLPALQARLLHGEARPTVRLPRGAYVELRRRPNGQRVVRIARATKPTDDRSWARWRLELRTFKVELGLKNWAHAAQAPIAGVAAAFVEPAQEEFSL